MAFDCSGLAMKHQVQKKCAKSTKCHFAGYVANVDEMIFRIDQADIVVIPAKTELFGISLAEVFSWKAGNLYEEQGLDGFLMIDQLEFFLKSWIRTICLRLQNHSKKLQRVSHELSASKKFV